jgi:hypothetical protein
VKDRIRKKEKRLRGKERGKSERERQVKKRCEKGTKK